MRAGDLDKVRELLELRDQAVRFNTHTHLPATLALFHTSVPNKEPFALVVIGGQYRMRTYDTDPRADIMEKWAEETRFLLTDAFETLIERIDSKLEQLGVQPPEAPPEKRR